MTEIKIGDLRWRVLLATRTMLPPTNGVPISGYSNQRTVYANVQPASSYTLMNSLNTDPKNPITHTAVIRHQNQIEMFDMIFRKTTNPDGTTVEERFHIISIKYIDGRKRFMELSLSLEKSKVKE